MTLLDLPTELLTGCILPLLDLASLYAFKQTCHQAVRLTSDDVLYRALVFNHALHTVQTCSATGVSPHTYRHWEPPHCRAHSDELSHVVASQRCLSGYYDRVSTWEQFARKRTRLDERWRRGDCTEESLVFNLDIIRAGTWRFKLDPEARLVVTSGAFGGHQAWDRSSARLVWSLPEPHSRWPHVELSDGYLLLHIWPNAGGDYFVVFRRDDILFPPPRYDTAVLESLLSVPSIQSLATSNNPKYTPFAIFPAFETRASKMRFPYFVGANEQYAYVYHILDGTVKRISIADFNPEVLYVELSDEHVLIAGDLVVCVYRFETGQLVGTFPPSSARDLLDFPPAGEWTAVHHGRDLVAAHSSGYLLWARHWRTSMSATRQQAHELVKILDVGRVVQLSVENNRAVFVVEHDGLDDNVNPRHSLWVLHLDLDATDDHLPVPKCIAFPLPTRYAPSRVECSTDECYISAQSAYLPGGRCRDAYENVRFEKRSYRWRSVTGKVLYAHPLWATQEREDDMSVAAQLEWQRTTDETSNILFDALAIYRFS